MGHDPFTKGQKLKTFPKSKHLQTTNQRSLKKLFCFMAGKHHGGKGENTGDQHFLLFPHNVSRRFFPGLVEIVSQRLEL